MAMTTPHQWVRNLSRLGPTGRGAAYVRLVGRVIADHADSDGGNSSPGVGTIADDAALSRRAVGQAMTVLRQEGWLLRTHTGRRQLGYCDVYQLTVPCQGRAGLGGGGV